VKRFKHAPVRRKASGHDVARLAGVSRTTVSYVLNGRDVGIPEETRARVQRAAEQLGYRPNGIARSLVSGRTQTIGVIVPVLNSAFSAEVVNGIQLVSGDPHRDYRMLLAYSHNDPDEEVKQACLLLEHRVDGIICVTGERSVAGTTRWLAEAAKEGAPCVVVDDRLGGWPVDRVVSDDFPGAKRAVEHLLGLGHRRIAHLCAGTRTSPARERLEGYRAALVEAGVGVDEALIAGDSFDPEEAAALTGRLLDLPEPPTALFVANDIMAAAVMAVIAERGVRVPEDLALVGFADVAPAAYMRLTTVRQSPRAMGKQAAERLYARIENPELPPEEIVLPTELVVRQSCGAKHVERPA
jgi:DNA-binding LacI/PurR family transcriptional regulator